MLVPAADPWLPPPGPCRCPRLDGLRLRLSRAAGIRAARFKQAEGVPHLSLIDRPSGADLPQEARRLRPGVHAEHPSAEPGRVPVGQVPSAPHRLLPS